jgi:histidine phosphotransferase ChpT
MAIDAPALKLAEMLSARLCHELVSPIGAIANGIEILEDEPDFAGDAGALIAESARAAARRLQFYRLAYGSVVAITDELARSTALDFFADGKIGCEWPAGLPHVPPNWQKLTLNLLLLASEALPRGGRVVLSHSPSGIAACASGDGVRLASPVPELLAGADNPELLTPRTVQAAFTRALAECHGARIAVAEGRPGELTLAVCGA